MKERNFALIMVIISLALGAFAFAKIAQAAPAEKVTICHAAGLEGTTHYIELTIAYPAVYGPAGHFFENGTTRAGHEQDYIGPCEQEETTSTTTTSTTVTSLPPSTTTTISEETTTTVVSTETSATTVEPTTSTIVAIPSTTPEELPYTGPREDAALMVLLGLSLVTVGYVLVLGSERG